MKGSRIAAQIIEEQKKEEHFKKMAMLKKQKEQEIDVKSKKEYSK